MYYVDLFIYLLIYLFNCLFMYLLVIYPFLMDQLATFDDNGGLFFYLFRV